MNSKKVEEFKEYLTKIENLNNTIALVDWDMRICMPKGSIDSRGNMLAYLSGEDYKMRTSERMRSFIESLKNEKDLDEVTSSSIENCEKEYNRTKKIPANRYTEYVKLASKSSSAWEEAKEKSDFSIFQPYLEKMVEFQKEFINYWGYEDNRYDTLLDFYEPGLKVKDLDITFNKLKKAIISILDKIRNSGVSPRYDFLQRYFSKEEQEEFDMMLLREMEFNFNIGRMDESIHPFTTSFGNKDVRITTNYHKNEFVSAMFSCLHEGGHALYEQDIPDELSGTLLNTGASMAVHESQSRFYENIIGRSKSFWKYFFPKLKAKFKQFEDVSFDEFYSAVNRVEPSLIRTESDELTYSLHIIIRYEIEKKLINGEIEVKDLPRIWNQKYKEYLGVEPRNDAEGVLQDMHWSDGSFGYFPSYALGNLYGAQFFDKMVKDIPDLYGRIERGDIGIIHSWLKDNVHKYGAVYKPNELIKKVTGENLNAEYFINYLYRKYSDIYKFEI
ncbi:carboxypeptidase M32 [Clostridium oryzae]|uniref:Metal-dependent carboxypeptidase n=1 Tax=Clostridium oryzae TaxID=1450648 RepID=A0A1V4IFT3_9CLOT|nr:carboxypeptidase M32 [Clostridium oryzae]OPJ58387.1 carboxypeptidase 1 [Clostridium oryzae]